MSIKSLALAGAALFVLTTGASVALAHPQDEQVRQLNLEQLRKAQAARGVTTSEPSMPASETTTPNGQGGPEYQAPPSPEEGMTNEGGTPTPTDQEPATTPPPPTQPE